MRNVLSPVIAGFVLLFVCAIIVNSIINGEQLVIKFLATLVVAAVGLYIISDLRLRQSERSAIISNQSSTIDAIAHTEPGPLTMPLFRSKTADKSVPTAPPANSTAAFIADMDNAKKREKALTDNRSYAAMGRISHKRHDRSISQEWSTEESEDTTRPEALISSTPSAESLNVGDTDIEETTLDATPLETLKVEAPTEGLSPNEFGCDTTAPSDASNVDDSDADLTSFVSLSAEIDNDEADEEAPWAIVDNVAEPAEQADKPQVDDYETESNDTEDISSVANDSSTDASSTDASSTEGSDTEGDEPEVVEDESSNDLPHRQPRSRRIDPDQVDVATLRPVDPAAILEPAQGISLTDLTRKRSDRKAPSTNATPAATHSTATLAAINDAIADGERSIVNSLLDRGVLSTEGPITDDDVPTMIYVAFTSSELRKLLQDRGTIDSDNGEICLEGLTIYSSADLEAEDQYLTVGSNDVVNKLDTGLSL